MDKAGERPLRPYAKNVTFGETGGQLQKSGVTLKKTISLEQCRAARALLGWTQERLKSATARGGAKVAKKTIADFEAGNRVPYERTLADIRRALEANGIEFIPGNGKGPGVRLLK